MKEIWKDIEGYSSIYKISNYGRVKSLKRKILYKDGRIRKYDDKILKPRIDPKGYYFISLFDTNHCINQQRIHVLVAKSFIINNKNKPCVNHKDSIRLNNYYENLEWVSHKENTQHAIKHNRIHKPAKKINEKIVEIIRYNWDTENITQKKLGYIYGLKQPQISRIVNHVNWK